MRRFSTVIVSISTLILIATILVAGCSPREKSVTEPILADASSISRPTSEASILAFCGDCHRMPNPQSFARERWQKEVKQGFRLYAKSGRVNLVLPDFEATVAYFQKDAPDALAFTQPNSRPDTRFEIQRIALESDSPIVTISHLLVHPRAGETSPFSFSFADIGSGVLLSASVPGSGSEPSASSTAMRVDRLVVETLGKTSHPAHIEEVDMDQDGILDFIVADLGTMNPSDQKQASLWYFRGRDDGGYDRNVLKLGLSRLSSVRALDHDLDGDIDLVVSDFGLHFVGSIYLLTNHGVENGIPQFEWTVLDDRPGAIDTPIVDFDQDGRPDIVSLVSQHHETVDVHLNRGDGKFETHRIHDAPWPSHGSSGLEVVDLDQDGDLDVLYTNGDTFDDQLAKPYHAIHWLENEGSFPFRHHLIENMPGVYCARSGDLDLDGDLDIVAVSLLGQPEIMKQPPGMFEGVIWMEQVSPGEFRRHSLQVDRCDAVTCNLLDWDGDGDLDVLVPPSNEEVLKSPQMTLYLNTTRSASP